MRDKRKADLKAEKYLTDFGDAILRLAYSYVHNLQDAEDILQETLIRTILAKPEFENSAHAKGYLLKVAANLSKNLLKKKSLHRTDELKQELIADEREDLSFLWQEVKKLPPVQREAVHLFYEEGYSTREIAGILGRREATVRSDLRRGRAKLRKLLEEYP